MTKCNLILLESDIQIEINHLIFHCWDDDVRYTTLDKYNVDYNFVIIIEPRHEKTGFCISVSKGADQLRSNCAAYQRLCFRYIDRTIPLLSKSEVVSQ